MNNKQHLIPTGQAIVALWTMLKTAVLIRKPQNAMAYHACRKMCQACNLNEEQITGISFSFYNSRPASGFAPGHLRLLTTAEKMLKDFRSSGIEDSVAKQRVAKELFLPIIEIGNSGRSRKERQERIRRHIESCEGPDQKAATDRFVCKAMLLSLMCAK